jgi:hypothetical protein
MNDPENGADVLAEWGTRSYFEARGRMWTFSGKLEVPPRAADDGDFLRMAREAFHAAAGPRDAWPRGITFISVHCDITELMSADAAHAIKILVRIFLQAGDTTNNKWETWLQQPSHWRPLRSGLCGNEEFESASTEARSVSSGWLEIITGELSSSSPFERDIEKLRRDVLNDHGCEFVYYSCKKTKCACIHPALVFIPHETEAQKRYQD